MPEHPGLSSEKRALLQKFLRGELGTGSPLAGRIGRRAPGVDVPLSTHQEQRWASAQLAPGIPIDIDFITVVIRAPLAVDALRRAFTEIVARHEILRTTIVLRESGPCQEIAPRIDVSLPTFDLRSIDASARNTEAIRLATTEARRPFALAGDLLWRAFLVHLDDRDHRLFLLLHHLLADCYSAYNLLLTELSTLYTGVVAGQPASLPPVAAHYGDYAVWQRTQPETALSADDLAYWKERLDPSRVTVLPADRARIEPRAFKGAVQTALLSPAAVGALESLTREEGATLFMTLLAAFLAVARDRTDADEIVVGTETGSRHPPDAERVLGFFLNPLVIRTDVSGDPSFRKLVRRVRETTTEAMARAKVPHLRLLDHVGRRNDARALYQIMFRVAPPYPILAPGWEVSAVEIDAMTSKVDISIDFYHLPRGMIARLEYDSQVFAPSTIEGLLATLITVLERAAAMPSLPISALCASGDGVSIP